MPVVRVSWDPQWFDRAWVGPYGVSLEDFTGEEVEDTNQACLRWLADDDGEVVGFEAMPLSDYVPLDEPDEEDPPRFEVPALGLSAGTAYDVLLAADDRWGRRASDDVIKFHDAVAAEDLQEASRLWQQVVDLGDVRGLYGLGYTLVSLERLEDAEQALQRWTEHAPANAWGWCWLGRAREALNDRDAAIDAYRRAVAAHRAGSGATDAPALLQALGVKANEPTRPPPDEGHTRPSPAETLLRPRTMEDAYLLRSMAARRTLLNAQEAGALSERALRSITLVGDAVLMTLLLVIETARLQHPPVSGRSEPDDELGLLLRGLRRGAVLRAWTTAAHRVAAELARGGEVVADDAKELAEELRVFWQEMEGTDDLAEPLPHGDQDWIKTEVVLEQIVARSPTRLAVFGTGSREDRRELAVVWANAAEILRDALAGLS